MQKAWYFKFENVNAFLMCFGAFINNAFYTYRLTSDERHLHRTRNFAEFMLTEEFQRNARTPDAPYSLH
jgi:hypothetical protein